jgi:hypothetical protein
MAVRSDQHDDNLGGQQRRDATQNRREGPNEFRCYAVDGYVDLAAGWHGSWV